LKKMFMLKFILILSGLLFLLNTAGAEPATDVPALLKTIKVNFDNGELVDAMVTVQEVLKTDPNNYRALKFKQLVEARLRAKKALQAEASFDSALIKPNTIAVVSFVNTGSPKNLDPLQKGLAEMITTDLSQVDRLTVIERVQMQKLRTEMSLGGTGLLEEGTSARMGKLIGAAMVVNGSFKNTDSSTISLDAGIVNALGKEVKVISAVSGKLTDIFKLEKKLVFALIKEMEVVLTDEEKEKIEVIATENIMAFLAYSKGLDAEDRGEFDAAGDYYGQAQKLDPAFKDAAQKMNQLKEQGKEEESKEEAGPKKMTTDVYVGSNFNLFMAGRATDLSSSDFMPELSVSGKIAGAGLPGRGAPGAINNYLTSSGIGGKSKEIEIKIILPDIPDIQ